MIPPTVRQATVRSPKRSSVETADSQEPVESPAESGASKAAEVGKKVAVSIARSEATKAAESAAQEALTEVLGERSGGRSQGDQAAGGDGQGHGRNLHSGHPQEQGVFRASTCTNLRPIPTRGRGTRRWCRVTAHCSRSRKAPYTAVSQDTPSV